VPVSLAVRRLRIFVACPSDVVGERSRLSTAVESLQSLAQHCDLVLELLDWRKVIPDMGRPEQIILDQLQPTSWDIFIGIIWHRFGTAPNATDADSGKPYLSGTEEEFKVTYRLWQVHRRPRVLFYWCQRDIPLKDLDSNQFNLVKQFFAAFAPDGNHPGLYQTFPDADSLERLVRQNLTGLLLKYSEQVKSRHISQKDLAVLTTGIVNTLPRRGTFVGRRNEVESALSALTPSDRGWGVVIDGIGGIGKTALAIEVAHLCREEGRFDAYVFVTAKREELTSGGIQKAALSATTLDELLNEVARALGQTGIAQIADLIAKQRSLLDSLRDERGLVIFDNLETLTREEQNTLMGFLRFLPQGCKAIVTTRQRIASSSGVTLRLGKLDWPEAQELIRDEISKNRVALAHVSAASDDAWKQLYDHSGGSPLALMWILGLVRTTGLSLQRAGELLTTGSSDSSLTVFLFADIKKRMDVYERLVLGALSYFVTSASPEALAATSGLSGAALENVLVMRQSRAKKPRYSMLEFLGASCLTCYSIAARDQPRR
jgi:hypothetical protein